jgi:hypothetical protein
VHHKPPRKLGIRHRFRADENPGARSAALSGFVLLWVLSMVSASTASQPGVSLRRPVDFFEFTNGVVVDLSESTAYLMNPRPGLDAVNLHTGELLWQTLAAARPLLQHDGRIIAQAETGSTPNALSLVVLSARDAGRILFEIEVALPEIVQVSVVDRPETAFRATAHMQGERVIIRWSYSRQQIEGAPPGPGEQPVSLQGAVWMEVDSGRHGILALDEAAAASEEGLPNHVEGLIANAPLSGFVWLTGGILAAIERTASGDVTLRRWRASTLEPLPDVDLGDEGFTYRYVSVDGRHALASRRVGAGEADWLWRLYSLESGRQVTQLRQRSAATRFFLTSSHLIHEAAPTRRSVEGGIVQQPRRLRGVDLRTAAESWARPLRDTAYRGPYPPRTGPRNASRSMPWPGGAAR